MPIIGWRTSYFESFTASNQIGNLLLAESYFEDAAASYRQALQLVTLHRTSSSRSDIEGRWIP